MIRGTTGSSKLGAKSGGKPAFLTRGVKVDAVLNEEWLSTN